MFGWLVDYLKRLKRIKGLQISRNWWLLAALFILTIGATAFYTFEKKEADFAKAKSGDKPVLSQIQVLPPEDNENNEVETASALINKKEVAPLPLSITESGKAAEDHQLESTGKTVMKWPGQGEIITKFGFTYSETFNDLRFHTGIDIALPPGYEVRAALPGTVVSVSSTPMWGYEIVIKHNEGLETRYKGIKSLKEEKGYQVEKGDIIGRVVHSPKYEAKMNPHLHFEVYEFGKAIDPMQYL
jgi:murein DD-endopeptidase MepM/ murein hydrolase activator NlpD